MRRVGGDSSGDAGSFGAGRALSTDYDWLRELFEPFGPVSVRRMFGGAGIYRDGIMFALVSDGEIYLKADDSSAARFRAAGCRPFTYAKDGKRATMSYWSAPAEALDNGEELKAWAELAYEVAVRAKTTGKRQAGKETSTGVRK